MCVMSIDNAWCHGTLSDLLFFSLSPHPNVPKMALRSKEALQKAIDILLTFMQLTNSLSLLMLQLGVHSHSLIKDC